MHVRVYNFEIEVTLIQISLSRRHFITIFLQDSSVTLWALQLNWPFTGRAENILFKEANEVLTKWNFILLRGFVAAVLHIDPPLRHKLYAEITMERNESWICAPWSDVYSRNISQPQTWSSHEHGEQLMHSVKRGECRHLCCYSSMNSVME